jgi:hypothetical protein
VEKVLECFGPNKANKDGRKGTCNACLADAKKLKRVLLFSEPWPAHGSGLRGTRAAASSRRTTAALKAIHAKDKP